MTENLETVNTPHTLGVTPRYVLQHNKISRGINELSATARKLTAMAMSLLPADMSSLTASFSFADFCKAMGFEKGGKSYKILRSAIHECMKCVITVETEPDESGKREWKQFTWFSMAGFSEKTGQATMEFSDKLAAFLTALKWVYAKIDLKAFGSLQSKYALHLYEILISYSFLKGKNGNQSNEWYVQFALPDLRSIMGIPEGTYRETNLFKRKVIESPVKEINKAGIGLEITIESIKQGRSLAAIKFICKQASKQITSRLRRGEETTTITLELPGPDARTKEQRKDKELEHLMELYPDEYAELFKAEMDKPSKFPIPEGFKRMVADVSAKTQLQERHGTVK